MTAILPPYARDPNRPQALRRRALAVILVSLFCLIWGFGFAIFGQYFLLFFAAPIPILAMIAIWALPDMRTAPTRALGSMLFVFMVCLVIWPNYIAFAPPGVPWITMTRLTGFPMVAILLICVSTSAEFRRQTAEAMKATPLLSLFFILFNILELISIVFSKSVIFSFDNFINSLIGWTAIFFISVYVFLKPGSIERMIRLLWLTALPIGIIAFFEFRVKHPLWQGHIPSFLHINDPSVQRALTGSSRGSAFRAASTFGTALGLAEYVSLLLPFVLNFAIGPYRAATRIAAFMSVPFLFMVVFVSGSRLGFVGSILAVAFTILAWAGMKWARDRGSFVAPATVLVFPAGLLAFLVSSFFIGAIRVRVWGAGADGGAASTQARGDQFAMGWPKILSQPWGHGIGMAAQTLGYAPYGVLTIDTYYLAILLEFGPVGFVLYYGMFALGVFECARLAIKQRWREPEAALLTPLAIALINFFVIKSVFSETTNHPIVFMLLGTIVALAARLAREPAEIVAEAKTEPRPAPIKARRPAYG